MSLTIHKYPLALATRQVVTLPVTHRVLSLQVQDGVPTLWVLVDVGFKENFEQPISMFGTGGVIPYYPGAPLGTVQLDGFVWHFFAEEIDRG